MSQKTGPLRIIWDNFTNSQRLLIIFGTERPYSIFNWCGKKFLNWFRTSCVFAIATVVTWRTWTANFWADFEQRVIDRAINEWENNYWPVSRPKNCSSNTCCNFWHPTVFRQKHCLFKRFNFFKYRTQIFCEILFKFKNVLSSYAKMSCIPSGPVVLWYTPSSGYCCYGKCAAGSKPM